MTAPLIRNSELAGALPRGWLLDRIALYLNRPVEMIDPSVPLAEYGMDSVCALSLCGDLEDELELIVEPTLLWDYPTVDSLVRYLAVELAGRGNGEG
jgi:acyl carrier protein